MLEPSPTEQPIPTRFPTSVRTAGTCYQVVYSDGSVNPGDPPVIPIPDR